MPPDLLFPAPGNDVAVPPGRTRTKPLGERLAPTYAADDGPLLLTVDQAAQRLGIGRSLLYELIATGDVDSVHVGRLRRIPAEALTA
jgi:excisionase family DNA binding protein